MTSSYKTASPEFISHIPATDAQGFQIARVERMPDSTIIPVKLYARPEFNTPPTIDDDIRLYKLEIALLQDQVRCLRDKVYKMEAMLKNELKMWKRGLLDGEWESPDTVKRRLSRIQGAIDYKGRADSPSIDTSDPELER